VKQLNGKSEEKELLAESRQTQRHWGGSIISEELQNQVWLDHGHESQGNMNYEGSRTRCSSLHHSRVFGFFKAINAQRSQAENWALDVLGHLYPTSVGLLSSNFIVGYFFVHF
jgi:hypothetical protein